MDSFKLGLTLRSVEGLDPLAIDRTLEYYRLLLEENKVQNLTRITSEKDFFYHNVVDIQALQSFGFSDYSDEAGPIVDLGSGGGVPGLLYAAMDDRHSWLLVESEKRKADFLTRTVKALGMSKRVTVSSERFETLFKRKNPGTVVVRAVASVNKLLTLMDQCSTWTELVVMKSKNFADEWKDAEVVFGKRASLSNTYEYQSDGAYRILARFVPRGTVKSR